MKKILLSLLLVFALTLSTLLVACGGNEYDDSESRQPVETHDPADTGSGSVDETQKPDSALGVVEDTEEGWGKIHK